MKNQKVRDVYKVGKTLGTGGGWAELELARGLWVGGWVGGRVGGWAGGWVGVWVGASLCGWVAGRSWWWWVLAGGAGPGQPGILGLR